MKSSRRCVRGYGCGGGQLQGADTVFPDDESLTRLPVTLSTHHLFLVSFIYQAEQARVEKAQSSAAAASGGGGGGVSGSEALSAADGAESTRVYGS